MPRSAYAANRSRRNITLETLAESETQASPVPTRKPRRELQSLAGSAYRKTISTNEMEEAIDRVIAPVPERKAASSRLRSLSPREGWPCARGVVVLLSSCADGISPTQDDGGCRKIASRRTVITNGQVRSLKITWPSRPGGSAAKRSSFQGDNGARNNDIERVTEMARRPFTRYGMSKKLGLFVALGIRGACSWAAEISRTAQAILTR